MQSKAPRGYTARVFQTVISRPYAYAFYLLPVLRQRDRSAESLGRCV